MLGKISVVALVGLGVFLGYAATRPSEFRYERTGIIKAPVEQVYPFLSNLRLGSQWSPYEEKDPNMDKNYEGAPGTVGSRLSFAGNVNAGTGRIEIVKLVPNEAVDIRLDLTKPMEGSHMISYRLKPVEGGTEFVWSQSGKNGFVGKVMSVVIDCDKMFGTDMEHGIAKLKHVVETHEAS